MKGFGPYKRNAKEFNYTPRFFDPQKEERDRRRAELRGSRPEGDDGDYVVGERIRRQREARNSSRGSKRGSKRTMWIMIMGVTIVFLLSTMLIPRLFELFMGSGSTQSVEAIDEYKDFDPYAPIRIVPNDYQGE
ncbi:MAG: hypothetical protein SNI51_02015 [Rikenellaceae bacterium]